MEKGRNEYLLSDIGVIWRGTQNKPIPLLWEYGQVGSTLYMYMYYLFTNTYSLL